MARNKIEDLRDHLFEQLERLKDDELNGDKLKEEIKRSEAISNIASAIIESGKMEVIAMKVLGATSTNSQLFKESIKQLN